MPNRKPLDYITGIVDRVTETGVLLQNDQQGWLSWSKFYAVEARPVLRSGMNVQLGVEWWGDPGREKRFIKDARVLGGDTLFDPYPEQAPSGAPDYQWPDPEPPTVDPATVHKYDPRGDLTRERTVIRMAALQEATRLRAAFPTTPTEALEVARVFEQYLSGEMD